MADKLVYDLQDILRDKNTHLLPENLKKDVTCLGVTGSLEEGSIIAGIETVQALATMDIAKNTSCALQPQEPSGYVMSKITTLPRSSMSSSDMSILKHVCSVDGQLVFIRLSGNDWYPYYLIGDEYVALTVAGESAPMTFARSLTYTSYPPPCFDSDTGIYYIMRSYSSETSKHVYQLFAYKVDVSNYDLKLFKMYTLDEESPVAFSDVAAGKYNGNPLLVKNGNVFIQVQLYENYNGRLFHYYLDDITDTAVYVQTILSTENSNGYCNILNWSMSSQNDLILALAKTSYKGSSTTVDLRKYSLDEDGVYRQKIQSPTSFYARPTYYRPFGIDDTITTLGIFKDESLLLYVASGNSLKICSLDSNTYQMSDSDIIFDDGLDTTKVSNIYFAQDGAYLFVQSTDTTTYSSSELIRLYRYSAADLCFKFLGCPSGFHSTVKEGLLPIVPLGKTDINNLVYADNTTNNWYSLYHFVESTTQYSYIATPSNVAVSKVDCYGIATSNITEGQVRKCGYYPDWTN